MTFQPVYTDEQRSAIWELKEEGLSGREVAQLCSTGIKGLEPFDATDQTINRLYREERAAREAVEESPLAALPFKDATAALVRRGITICERSLDKFQRELAKKSNKARPEAREFKEWTMALERLHRMSRQIPAADKDNGKPRKEVEALGKPDGFLEGLASESASPNGS